MKQWIKYGATHVFLLTFVILWSLPLYFAWIAASHDGASLMHAPLPIFPGNLFWVNVKHLLMTGFEATASVPLWLMLLNSFIMAIVIAVGKIILALFSSFALVYFEFPLKRLCFVLIFLTLMLPVEVRIVPTFEVVVSMGMMNSYAALTLPLMASATATFLLRQWLKTLSLELVDAAKMDGAGPWRFFFSIVLPLSKTQMASLFIILFIYGWNQYLWPLVITTSSSMTTVVMGIRSLVGVADQMPQWHYILAMSLVSMLPPVLVVILFQRFFERGLQTS